LDTSDVIAGERNERSANRAREEMEGAATVVDTIDDDAVLTTQKAEVA
jgi:hypothetical protein